MASSDETLDDELRRLGAETAGIAPRADFVLRVMQRIESDRDDWSRGVMRWARLSGAVASVTAVACVALAWNSANAAQYEEASNYGMSEVFE